MPTTCRIVPVEPVLLAVAEAELDRREIAPNIRRLFDVVYTWLKTAPVKQSGHNYALYDKGRQRDLLVRVGFPVSGAFADGASVKSFELAPGRAAHAVHVGPYSELHRTYGELHSWCRSEGLKPASQSWEVYGDWHEDLSRLETGLYLRLAESSR